MQLVSTPNAPQAIGPYSQATLRSNVLYVSGQIAIDPKTGDITANTVSDQTQQIFRNITAILEEADMSLSDVVKATIYFTSTKDFQAVNRIYKSWFKAHKPKQSAVEVSALPKAALVKIEIIATAKRDN